MKQAVGLLYFNKYEKLMTEFSSWSKIFNTILTGILRWIIKNGQQCTPKRNGARIEFCSHVSLVNSLLAIIF